METLDKILFNVEREKLIGANTGTITNEEGLFYDGQHLGTVKRNYTLIQNHELLKIITLAIEQANMGNKIIPAGSMLLNGHKQVGFQLKMDDEIIEASSFIKEEDRIRRFITVLNSFDGKSSVAIGTHHTVMFCKNQLSYFYGNSVRFRHTSKLTQNISNFVDSLIDVIKKEVELLRMFKVAQNTPVESHTKSDFVFTVLGIDKGYMESNYVKGVRITTNAENKIYNLDNSIATEMRKNGITYWSLLQGVTRYTTHMLDINSASNPALKLTNKAIEYISNEVNV